MPARNPLDYDRLTSASMFFEGITELTDVEETSEPVIRETEADLLDKEKLCHELRRQLRGNPLPGVEVDFLQELSDAPRV